jgi:hypothetical protein
MQRLIKGNITPKKNCAKTHTTAHLYGAFLSIKNVFQFFMLGSILELKTYRTPRNR